jgi:imidazoleglycerol-phosphate dehydratase
MRVNFHCHNAFSSDGTGSVEELARAARDCGIRVLCLTNHVERLLDDGRTWDFEADEAIARLDACRLEIERCRPRIPEVELLFGAELEYRREWREGLERLEQALPFDFLLGSVHVAGGLQISGGPDMDSVFAGRREEEVYGPYFETVLEMLRWGGFDVVSHLDLVKRFGAARYGAFDPARYAAPLAAIFEECARRDIGIEVNGSGLFATCAEPFPGPALLTQARAAAVPFITLGTDSHKPEHVGRGLPEIERLARTAGFAEVAVVRGRVRSMVPLAKAGNPPRVENPSAEHAGDPLPAQIPSASDARDSPPTQRFFTADGHRVGQCNRVTGETRVSVVVDIDGGARSRISTGIGFFDHMLETLARHAMLDLEIDARSDLGVDEHHLVEDVGLALGEALASALDEKRGTRRFGSLVPMDESLAEAAVDLAGRPRLVFRARFRRERVGGLPTELVEEFFRALTDRLRATVHLHMRYGSNDHHKIEALFKAFALALRAACEHDPRRGDGIPSSKGTLTT